MNFLYSLILALGFGGAVQPVSEFDIPYFMANPEVRTETLRRCHDDFALSRTPECENAEAAATRTLMGRPLSSYDKNKLPPERKRPAVINRGAERGA